MAKVEMNYKGDALLQLGGGGGTFPDVGGEHDVIVDSSFDEYAEKVWKEGQLSVLVHELVSKRSVIQRKIDAARKRLKRLTSRLNAMERDWSLASA